MATGVPGASRQKAYRAVLRDRRGVAAIEFAIVLPLMLLMYIGTVDITRGVLASRDLDLLSRTLSDITAQQSTSAAVPSQTLANIFTASSAVMAPFSTSGLKMTVSAIDIEADSNNNCCQAVVRWTYTQGGTMRPCSTNLSLVAPGTPPAPSNIQQAIASSNSNNAAIGASYTGSGPTYVIVADTSYTYVPFFMQQAWAWFSGGMQKTTYMVPRSASGPITLADTSPPAGTAQKCF